jgi:hypothetical protein
MMDAESRFDYFEGRVEEQSRNWERLFADIGCVDQRIDVLSARIDTVSDSLSARIDRLDDRMDAVGRNLDGKIHSVDQKLDRRFDTLQQEISKQFRWTIGVMVTLTIGVITAVLTR